MEASLKIDCHTSVNSQRIHFHRLHTPYQDFSLSEFNTTHLPNINKLFYLHGFSAEYTCSIGYWTPIICNWHKFISWIQSCCQLPYLSDIDFTKLPVISATLTTFKSPSCQHVFRGYFPYCHICLEVIMRIVTSFMSALNDIVDIYWGCCTWVRVEWGIDLTTNKVQASTASYTTVRVCGWGCTWDV